MSLFPKKVEYPFNNVITFWASGGYKDRIGYNNNIVCLLSDGQPSV